MADYMMGIQKMSLWVADVHIAFLNLNFLTAIQIASDLLEPLFASVIKALPVHNLKWILQDLDQVP